MGDEGARQAGKSPRKEPEWEPSVSRQAGPAWLPQLEAPGCRWQGGCVLQSHPLETRQGRLGVGDESEGRVLPSLTAEQVAGYPCLLQACLILFHAYRTELVLKPPAETPPRLRPFHL